MFTVNFYSHAGNQGGFIFKILENKYRNKTKIFYSVHISNHILITQLLNFTFAAEKLKSNQEY